MTEPSPTTRIWPSSPYDLADAHRCPSCFAVVSAPTCPSCGFFLTDSRAPLVLALGRRLLDTELSRQRLIDEICLSPDPVAGEADAAARGFDAARAPRTAVAAAPAGASDPVAAAPGQPPAIPVAARVAGPAFATTVVPPRPPLPASLPAESAPARIAVPASGLVAPATAGTADPAAPVQPPAQLPEARVQAPVPTATPPAPGATAAPPARRRRLTVPVLLLIVGVSLVGVAAVFFLLLAWFVAGIAVKALIIGAITLATIVTASWLARPARDLRATAEGVGALGVVLLALDAWAARTNDLFGTGAADPALYAGASALVIALLCRVWARLSGLRGPDLAASLAVPAGIGLLVGGLVALPPAEALVAGLLGAGAGGLVHALPAPWSSARGGAAGAPERVVLAASGIVSVVAAGVTAWVFTGDAVAVAVWSSVVVVVLGAAHAVLALRPVAGEALPAARLLSGAAGATAAAAAGLAGWQLALRVDEPLSAVLIGPVVAVAVAFVVDLLRRRTPAHTWAGPSFASGVIAGASIAGVALAWLWQGIAAIASGWTVWRTDAFVVPLTAPEAPLLAVVTAAALAVLLLSSPTLARPRLTDARAIAVAVLLLAAAARSAVPAVVVGIAAAVAIGALVAAVVHRRGAEHTPWGWLAAGIGAAIVAYAAGTATPWLWLVGILVAAGYPVALRLLLRPTGGPAVAAALAPVVVGAVSALLAPGALAAVTGVGTGEAAVVTALLQWVALAALAAAVVLPVERASRGALALSAGVLVALSLAGTATAAVVGSTGTGAAAALGEPWAGVARGAVLVVGLVAVALGRTRIDGVATIAAAVLIAPSAAALAQEVLVAFDVAQEGWAAAVLVAAATLVPVVAAASYAAVRPATPPTPEGAAPERPAPERPASAGLRTAADLGAAATVAVVAWGTAPALAWMVLAILAVGIAAVSTTRGWAAPAGAGDRFTTAAPGAPVSAAPRRLLLWPALAAVIASWWSWLGDGTPAAAFTTESYTIPAAGVLVAAAVALAWLRRRGESSAALGLGLAIGLWTSAVEGWTGDPLRGTIVAVVAAAIALALSFTPVRGIRPPSLVGAAVAVVAVALVATERAADDAWSPLWLVLLVGVAYASAAGMAHERPTPVASQAYAVVVPVASLVAGIVPLWPLLDDLLVVTGAFVVAGGLHLAAAGLDRLPWTAPTRWVSFAAAMMVGAGALVFGPVDALETVTLPLALMCLGGAVLGMLHRRRTGRPWPGSEAGAWVAGLLLAGVPSLFAAPEPVRVWTLIGAALAAAVAIAAVPGHGGETPVAADPPAGTPRALPDSPAVPPDPSAARRTGLAALRAPSALVLASLALAMGLRALLTPDLASGEGAAIVAAVGALAVAVLLTATADTRGDVVLPAWVAGAGTLLLAVVAFARADGDLAQPAVVTAIGGAIGVGGAAVLGLRRWSALGGVLAIGGLVVALVACGARFVGVMGAAGFEPDLWVLIAAAVSLAIGLAALRATASRRVGSAVGAGFALAAVLLAVAEGMLIATHDDGSGIRTAVTVSALTVAVFVGLIARERLGLALVVAAAISCATFGVLALVAFDVRPLELVTVPAALGGIAYGVRTLRRRPEARTWPALGPWLALLTVPSLLLDFTGSALWRVVALGVVAIAMVVAGAVLRLQAPLVLGSVVLLVHAVAQLWPWISSSYNAVPWWLWLGIGGALLIFIAARYEKRMRALRTAYLAVATLR